MLCPRTTRVLDDVSDSGLAKLLQMLCTVSATCPQTHVEKIPYDSLHDLRQLRSLNNLTVTELKSDLKSLSCSCNRTRAYSIL